MARKKTSVIQVMITGDSRDLQKATRGGVSGFEVLAGAAIAATKVLVSSATAIAGFSVREFAKFDEAMTKSTAIMGDLSDTMRKEMSDAARAVATSTTFAAAEAADAFFFLASAGLTAEQSIGALPRVAAFAQAGMFDLSQATDLLTDAQSALGLTSDDTAENLANMTRVSDVLVKANTLANASVEEFSQALTERAGAAMRALGVEIETGTAALAVFADQGIKGSKAGTMLNTTLEGLTRTAREQSDAYEALGVAVFDADGEMRNMADIVGDLERSLDGMSTEAMLAELATLGLTRQARDGVIQLLGNSEALREYEAALRDAGGTTDEIAEKQLKSFNAQLGLLRSGFADVGISIGEALAGPLGNLVKWFQEQIPAIKAFVEEAIPQVEAFVNRSIAKFREFKQFYDENLAEPLGNLMTRLRELATTGLGRVAEFKDRAVELLTGFAQAVADEDSEEAGRQIGAAISQMVEMAFDAGVDMAKIAGEWAAGQDWAAIGMAVGKEATLFSKGLFEGLFQRLDEDSGKMEFDWSSFMRLLAAGLILRIPVFRNALAGRSGLFALPIVGTVATALSRAVLLLTPGLGLFAGSIGRLLAGAIGQMVAGTAFAGIFSNFGLTMQRLFAGQFASMPARLLAVITGMFSGLGGFLLRNAKMLPTFIRQGLIVSLPTLVAWLKTGGLLTLLKGFAAVVGGIVAAIGGWPIVIVAAATLAFMEFVRRFRRWNEGQGGEYESFGERIVEFIAQGWENLKSWFVTKFIGWFRDRWNAFKDWLLGRNKDYEDAGESIVRGMENGINSQSGSLRDTLVGAASRAWNATKKFLGISSPSTLFFNIGENMMAGLAKGIDESAGIIQAAVGVNSAMAANEARRFAEQAEAQRQASGGSGGTTIMNVNVQGAIDPEGTARTIRRVLQDAERRSGVRVLS